MNLIKSIILVCLVLIPTFGFTQRWKLSRSEIYGGIGVTNYFGDIGGAEKENASEIQNMDIMYSRPNALIGYRYKLYDRVSLRGQILYARFYGSDVSSLNEGRKYSFSSNMLELSGIAEYHVTEEKIKLSYRTMSMRGKFQKFGAGINIYIFAGVGGAFYKVNPLDNFVESPRYSDKNIALIIPVGIGFKYPISSKTYVGLDFGRRFTTSDYIDGFSPESSEHNDAYYFTVINVSYKIKKKSNKRRRPEYRF